MTLPRNQTIQANCLKGLQTLPDDSVDCICTSPPYWGLRYYGDKEKGDEAVDIWDGEDTCEHEWNMVVKPRTSGNKGGETIDAGGR